MPDSANSDDWDGVISGMKNIIAATSSPATTDAASEVTFVAERAACAQARIVSAMMVSVGFWLPCEGKLAASVT
jgi:hypothetical protein